MTNKTQISTKLNIQLRDVEETLIIPLWARAMEAEKEDSILVDPLSVKILRQIEYDFGKLSRGKNTQISVCLRGLLMDRWVRTFLRENPQATVVEIGSGLNTRFERVDNDQVRWIDLDLPDAMNLRRQFFPESSRRKMIDGSVLEEDWIQVAQTWGDSPFLFLAEGVLMYFSEDQVKQLLRLLKRHFPGSLIAFDSMATQGIRSQRKHEVMKNFSACFRWGIDNIRQIEQWDPGYQVIEIKTFLDAPRHYLAAFPWWARLLYRIPAFKYAYRLSLVRLG